MQVTSTSGIGLGNGAVVINGGTLLFGNAMTVANNISGAELIQNFTGTASTVVLTGGVNTSGNVAFRTAGSVFNFQSSGNDTLSGVIGGTSPFGLSVVGGGII